MSPFEPRAKSPVQVCACVVHPQAVHLLEYAPVGGLRLERSQKTMGTNLVEIFKIIHNGEVSPHYEAEI